ncbi:MAG: hypothetical protein PWP23_1730 [Candidatus Sumerlaeota bacterium]|nr:hypothetical protein [Candidatus Sumerlaeota bacterium]
MPVAWRIVKEKHAASAFDGEGAFTYGGRWNSPGVRVVYASESLSLAALESLVHLNPFLPFRYVRFRVEFADALVEEIGKDSLVRDWNVQPPGPASKSVGDAWGRAARTPVLRVPSVIIPIESNFLLNPQHPGFRKVRISKPEPFALDPRLLSARA